MSTPRTRAFRHVWKHFEIDGISVVRAIGRAGTGAFLGGCRTSHGPFCPVVIARGDNTATVTDLYATRGRHRPRGEKT